MCKKYFVKETMRSILIDTDAGSDDAAALVMALTNSSLVVKGITVVAGNVCLEQGLSNVAYVTEICKNKIDIFAGCEGPLVRAHINAKWFHGSDGFGDVGIRPSNTPTINKLHATEAIVNIVNESCEIELVTLGPLTNIALSIKRDPSIVKKIKICTIMGGAPCCEGNITPAAEYNIFADPEAAKIVFHSGMKIRMIGWHLSRGSSVLNDKDLSLIANKGSLLSNFVLDSNRIAQKAYLQQTGEVGLSLPDAVAMACAIDPTICLSSSDHHVDIETESLLTLGMTVVDRLDISSDIRNCEIWNDTLRNQKNKINIPWKINGDKYKSMLLDCL